MFRSLKRAFLLLSYRARWQWAGMVCLSVVEAVAESIGAAAIFSLIKIIDNPAGVFDIPVVSGMYAALSWREGETIILSFTFMVCLFYISKNLFLSMS